MKQAHLDEPDSSQTRYFMGMTGKVIADATSHTVRSRVSLLWIIILWAFLHEFSCSGPNVHILLSIDLMLIGSQNSSERISNRVFLCLGFPVLFGRITGVRGGRSLCAGVWRRTGRQRGCCGRGA